MCIIRTIIGGGLFRQEPQDRQV